MLPTKKVYFQGFNALRFIAAYLVLLHHAEFIRIKYKIPSFENYSIFNNGLSAVQFFFVLSGFLITYLLLQELKATNTISIKQFYIRRVLRIWPLYFILVLLGIFFIPIVLKFLHFPYSLPYNPLHASLLYVLFLPFLVNFFYGTTLLDMLWSIGVEEQFYLIWAPLVKYFNKYILQVFFIIIIGRSLLLYYFTCINTGHSLILYLLDVLKFDLMSIGGVGAYFIYKHNKFILSSIIFNKFFQILLIGLLVIYLFFNNTFGNTIWYSLLFKNHFLSPIIIGNLFLYFLINVSLNSQSIIKLNHKWLNQLGELSYGIYMYHIIIVFVVIILFKNMLLHCDLIWGSILYYGCITILTILIAYLSNKFIEKRFLLLKNKFDATT